MSALEKVIVSRFWMPSALSASSKTLKPDSVKASSLLYMTTTLVRLYFSLAFLTVCGMTCASVSESRKMKSPCSVMPDAVLETARTGALPSWAMGWAWKAVLDRVGPMMTLLPPLTKPSKTVMPCRGPSGRPRS